MFYVLCINTQYNHHQTMMVVVMMMTGFSPTILNTFLGDICQLVLRYHRADHLFLFYF
jgi:hypothetical protein